MDTISLKEIFRIAKDLISELSPLENPDFRLEQAEYKEEEEVWDIVVSYLVEDMNKPLSSALSAISLGHVYQRMYKRVKIDKQKKVVGFYMFQPKG